MRKLLWISLMAGAAACASATTPAAGGSTSATVLACATPSGSFAMTYTPLGGTCPTEVLTAFEDAVNRDSTRTATACYTAKATSSTPAVLIQGQSCSAVVSGSETGTSTGYSGTASADISCPGGNACSATFKVTFLPH